MKYCIIFPFLIILFACSNESEQEINKENTPLVNEALIKELQDTTNPLNSIHPSNLSPDNSWMVALEVSKGSLISYTIQYQNGDTLTKKIAKKDAISGNVDYTSAQFLDNNTYQIPYFDNTKKEYFELCIYKDGSCKYIEHPLQ